MRDQLSWAEIVRFAIVVVMILTPALYFLWPSEHTAIDDDLPYFHEGRWYIDSTPAACARINDEFVCEKMP